MADFPADLGAEKKTRLSKIDGRVQNLEVPQWNRDYQSSQL